MKSTTIFEAYSELEFNNGQQFEAFLDDLPPRKARQLMKFREEVARRLDERDALVATRNMNQLRTFTDESGRSMSIIGKWGI